MKKLSGIVLIGALLFLSPSAEASCPNPFKMLDADQVRQNLSTSSDANGNCLFNTGVGSGSLFNPTPVVGSQLGVSATTVQTLTIPVGALYAWVDVKGGAANYTSDGTNPIASTTIGGLTLSSGSQLFLPTNFMNGFKIICQAPGCFFSAEYAK